MWLCGLATITIDHVTKSKDGRGRYSIGSERKLGGSDVHLGFEVVKPLHRGSTGLMRIVTHKDRRGFLPRPRAGELHLSSDPASHAITWDFRPASEESAAGGWRPTNLMERVSRYLERQSDTVKVGNIYRDVQGKRDYLIEAVRFLVGDGYATEKPGNHGSRLIRSTKPYREPSPTRPPSSPDTLEPSRPPVPPPIGGDGERDDTELERLLAIGDEMGLR